MSLPQEKDDWVLVDRVKVGDEKAFDALMERYKRPVVSFVYRMIGDAEEAQDVAQDVFVRSYHSICASRVRQTEGPFSTWLFQVARNAALDCLRRRKRHPAGSLAYAAKESGTIADKGKSATEEAIATETGRQIAQAVAWLPEDQRVAIVLAEYEDCSYSEIAAVLKCSRKSVEARLYRARHSLRRQLAGLLQ